MKCFTLHVMNLKYMKVSLFEISYKKKWTFSPYSNFFKMYRSYIISYINISYIFLKYIHVCVCIYIYIYIHNKYTQHTHKLCKQKLLFWMHLFAINRLTARFFIQKDLEKCSITLLAHHWMLQTADKHITIIHQTPVHQLMSCEVKGYVFVRNHNSSSKCFKRQTVASS